MSFNVSEEKEWMFQYKKIWNEVESQLFEKLATELIKGKYVRGKLKKWKKDIKQILDSWESSRERYIQQGRRQRDAVRYHVGKHHLSPRVGPKY